MKDDKPALDLSWRLLEEGRGDEAIRLLRGKPLTPRSAYRLLFFLPYATGLSLAEVRSISEDVVAGMGLAGPRTSMAPPRHGQARIGWLSGDFRAHSIARNLLPILPHMAGRQYLYSDVKTPDSFTEMFRNAADVWRDVHGIGDSDLADIIRADELSALVIVAARFDANRMYFGARRAAPVQISMHDVATSALPNVDYFIADPFLVPSNNAPHFSERVVRLPNFYIHLPLDEVPARAPRRHEDGERITFVSFNNPAKIGPLALEMWARTMLDVPQSRLVLKYRDFYDRSDRRKPILQGLARFGVSSDRVSFLPSSATMVEHLRDYGSADIALDTFPFTGSNTTFEALWMGVPVVTLCGETPVSRWTGAMLRALKLDELIARTPAEYVAIAGDLARDAPRLAHLRASLRSRVAASPLCDATGGARQMTRILRTLARTVPAAGR